jgi:flavin-binding protein dodecin
MAEHSIYKVVEIIGTSKESWEDAAKSAVLAAAQTLRDLRVAEVKQFDLKIEGDSVLFRTKLDVSFKIEGYEV